MLKRWRKLFFFVALIMAMMAEGFAHANIYQFVLENEIESEESRWEQIFHIGQAIHVMQPRLSHGKRQRFALAIFRACEKYEIDPYLLVAITQQESSFRDNLRMGRAGELGPCQITKMWIRDRAFRKEFKSARVNDLRNPEKSFLYAAWILSYMKKVKQVGPLPFWTYYNANRFSARLRYFNRVIKKVLKIHAHIPPIVAALAQQEVEPTVTSN